MATVADEIDRNTQGIRDALGLRRARETAGARKDQRFRSLLEPVSRGAIKTVKECPQAFQNPETLMGRIQSGRERLHDLQGARDAVRRLLEEIDGDVARTTAELAADTGHVYDTTTAMLRNPDSPLGPRLAQASAAMIEPMKHRSRIRTQRTEENRAARRQAAATIAKKDHTIAKLKVEKKFLQGGPLRPEDLVPAPGPSKS